MKNNKAKLLAVAVALGVSAQANAAIELYNQDGTTFSADGHFNAFYVHTDADDADTTTSGNQPEKQSRVRMGFLPNYIGFNVSKQIDDLKVGGRSSFWVTINDTSSNTTGTAIDVRQFYGTVDGDFGQVLFGKDFAIYGRSNLFSDELLLGTGLPTPNGQGVTLGNISTGYPYAFPVSQISYRTPVNNGFQLAVGVMDPDSGNQVDTNGNMSARFEAEATYSTEFDGGKFNAWLGAASGDSAHTNGGSVSGVAYGARIAAGGFQFTASGFDQEGIQAVFSHNTATQSSDTDSDGYLVQASYGANGHRVVLSHGSTDVEGAETELDTIAYFYDINSNLKLVAEYDQASYASGADTDQLAVGVALSW